MEGATNTNISEIIIQTINTIFEKLFSSIDNSLYGMLDDLVFIKTDILNQTNLENLFGTSASTGILLVANSLLFGFLLYFAIRYLMSHFIYSRTETPGQFIFKLILFGACMNGSYFLIEQIINLNSSITTAILQLGENIFNKEITFKELILSINTSLSIDTSSINIFSFDGMLKAVLTLSLFSLVFSYSLRYIMIKVFVLIAPFAFLSLCLSSTSWFFKSWFRIFFSLLVLQIFVAIILLILFSIDFSNANMWSKILYLGGMYALIRANSFVREFIGGLSTNVSPNVGNYLKLFSK